MVAGQIHRLLISLWRISRFDVNHRVSFYQLFLRGKPYLQKYMRRLPKTHKKLPMRKQDEPDFYLLDKTNPLPAIEDAPVPGGLSVSNALRGGIGGVGSAGMPAMAGGAGMGGVPPQGPVGMPGRGMMPPPTVSHAPQPRFSQGVYNSDALQGPDEMYGDMAQHGDRGMMSRSLMQSNSGAFRSPMGAQGMPHGLPGQGLNSGMASQMPSASRMAQQMGGRGAGISNQMYSSAASMSNQFMNPMQAGAGNRMGTPGMRRFRPLPPGIDGSAMPNDQGMMSSAGYTQDNMSQEEFYQQRQQQQMRNRMSQMDQMPAMSHMFDRAGSMGGQDPMPYGDMPAGKGEMYSTTYRDIPQMGGNDFGMYRGDGGMSQMGGSDAEYMGMVSPMRRNRPPM